MLKIQFAFQDLRIKSSALEVTARPLLEARSEALRIASRNQALIALEPYPDQFDLMARIAGALPKGRAHLKEWDFQDGKLKVVLVTQGNALSSSALVTALQLAGVFDNVQVIPGTDPKVMVVNMNILRTPVAGRV